MRLNWLSNLWGKVQFDSSPTTPLAVSPPVKCFNSTLVRFKPDLRGYLAEGRRSFNSTLVRFKPNLDSYDWTDVKSFNSTLVRFKRAG